MRQSISVVAVRATKIIDESVKVAPEMPAIQTEAKAIVVEAQRMGQTSATLEKMIKDDQQAILDRDARILALNGDVAKKEQAIAAVTAEKQEAILKYHDAWLGGKAWRWIWGLVGAVGGLLITYIVLDVLLPAGLNPLWWVVQRLRGK
jgi:hypothetical protein